MAFIVQRKFGKFKTPCHIAKLMVKWTIRSRHDLILDPCAGSGILLYEAIEQLEDLGASGRISKNIYGVGIDPFATENVVDTLKQDENIFCADFLKIEPSKKIFALKNDTELPLVDGIVCNPPYTRHQQLSQHYKKEIAQIIESEAGLEISLLFSSSIGK